MTQPTPTRHRYCPHCGAELVEGAGPDGRTACPNGDFVLYSNPKVAVGVVVELEGRILLVRRNHDPQYGFWSFPSGFVDAGEVVEEAATREVLEETGVAVRVGALLGVFSSAANPVVFIAYAGVAVGGTPAPGPEALEVGLFAPDALPDLAFDHDGEIIRAWQAARGSS